MQVESLSAVLHESTHVALGRPTSREGLFMDEKKAYRLQSYINSIFNTDSMWKVWNTSWGTIDKHLMEKYRNDAIERRARDSSSFSR